MNPDGRPAECRRDHLIGYGGAVPLPRAPIVSQKGRFTNRPYRIDGYAGVASFGRTTSRSIGGLCPPLALPPPSPPACRGGHSSSTPHNAGQRPAHPGDCGGHSSSTPYNVGQRPAHPGDCRGIAQQDANVQRPAHRMIVPVGGHL